MPPPTNPALKDKAYSRPTLRARELRNGATEAERVLWNGLRNRQVAETRFNRQFPVGPFICDFVARTPKLVIELDGSTHTTEEQRTNDARRTAFLTAQGFSVIRFWNREVTDNLEGVLHQIERVLADMPSPGPSRKREGGLWSPARRKRADGC